MYDRRGRFLPKLFLPHEAPQPRKPLDIVGTRLLFFYVLYQGRWIALFVFLGVSGWVKVEGELFLT